MAMDISSLVGGGAASLNDEMLDKLRAEDERVTVQPAEEAITEWEEWDTSFSTIKTQFTNLQSSLEQFSQLNFDNNVFDSVSTSVTGDSVLYDAIGTLEPGMSNINVTQLATRDVWQGDLVNEDSIVPHGSYEINGETININEDILYSEFTDKLDKYDVDATFSQVSDTEYRLVIKSQGTGEESKLVFGGDFNVSNIQVAQNLNATIDGVEFNTSGNSLQINDTLKMTAVSTGESSINIQKDPNSVIDAITNVVDIYNSLFETVSNESEYNTETEELGNLQNSSSIKGMLTLVKNQLMTSYGDGLNVFSYGFELDRYGKLSVDQDTLAQKMSESPEDVEKLFVGTPDNKGVFDKMFNVIDDLNSLDGSLYLYETNMDSKGSSLEEAKTKAIEDLDNKYNLMKTQFSRYSTIIAQMESSFSSLQFQIAEATASK